MSARHLILGATALLALTACDPATKPSISATLDVRHPGSFCGPIGSRAVSTVNGQPMTCVRDQSGRLRWKAD